MAVAAVGCLRRARRARPGQPVLYGKWTLYFETNQGDGSREPGFYKERRSQRRTGGNFRDIGNIAPLPSRSSLSANFMAPPETAQKCAASSCKARNLPVDQRQVRHRRHSRTPGYADPEMMAEYTSGLCARFRFSWCSMAAVQLSRALG